MERENLVKQENLTGGYIGVVLTCNCSLVRNENDGLRNKMNNPEPGSSLRTENHK